MKKLYTLIACTFLFAGANAQSDQEISSLTHNETRFNKVDAQDREVPFSLKTAASCDSLMTTNAAGNNFDGNMFDVSVVSNVTLETFSVNTDAGSWNIAIFYKTGTFVGSETTASAWTFLDSAITTSVGTSLAKVPVDLALPLMAGNTYAFYVTATSTTPFFYYTNGTTVGNTLASNAYMTVKEGNGGGWPFNVTFSPRNFNGELFFCPGLAGVEEAEASMFDVFPSPADDNISLNLEKFNGQNVKLSIINALGQVVESSSLKASGTTKLDVQEYHSGLYTIQIQAGDKAYHSKFVKR